MAENNNKSFCEKYLSEVSGIVRNTIDVMLAKGYDSVDTLLAIDVDEDLKQIEDISFGQKSILREVLQKLDMEYKHLRLESIDPTVRIARSLLQETFGVYPPID